MDIHLLQYVIPRAAAAPPLSLIIPLCYGVRPCYGVSLCYGAGICQSLLNCCSAVATLRAEQGSCVPSKGFESKSGERESQTESEKARQSQREPDIVRES